MYMCVCVCVCMCECVCERESEEQGCAHKKERTMCVVNVRLYACVCVCVAIAVGNLLARGGEWFPSINSSLDGCVFRGNHGKASPCQRSVLRKDLTLQPLPSAAQGLAGHASRRRRLL